jgi:hypothetical protein
VRAQADRGVQRRRALVEEIKRPDVDGAAGQVDSSGRGRSDTHGAIIAASAARVPDAEADTSSNGSHVARPSARCDLGHRRGQVIPAFEAHERARYTATVAADRESWNCRLLVRATLNMPYDITEHRHRFAVWAAARAAQRGFTTVRNLRDALQATDIQEILAAPSTFDISAAKFDEVHRRWCSAICSNLFDRQISKAT